MANSTAFNPAGSKGEPIRPPAVLGPVRDGVQASRFSEWRKTPVEGVFFSAGASGVFTIKDETLCWHPGLSEKEFKEHWNKNKCFPDGSHHVLDRKVKYVYIQLHQIAGA